MNHALMSHSESGSIAGPNAAANEVGARLASFRRIVLLTDGFSNAFLAKTAISLLRYRQSDIAAVLDVAEAGKTAEELFGCGGNVPVVSSLEGIESDAMFIGIAPPGGKLPDQWRSIVVEGLRRGMDVASGLHDFLSNDEEFTRLAAEHDCHLIDVRKNNERETAKCHRFRDGNLRVHTVGQDCSLGKMVVSLEVQLELARRGADAHFIATGQTGIMVSGDGVPVDCVVADFVNGAIENLLKRHEHHDILLIEGQGSLSHPSYSAVTAGLLHGSAPDGLIYCYEAGRETVKGLDGIELLPHRTLIEAYQQFASLRHPCRVIGIAMNGRYLSDEQAAEERERIREEFQLPVCDVYRHGAGELADAVENLRREIGNEGNGL